MKNQSTPKQNCRTFIIIYSLFCLIFLPLYALQLPVRSSGLLLIPIIQIVRQTKTKEEEQYLLLQTGFAILSSTLTWTIGIWLGYVNPLMLLFPAGLAFYWCYRTFFSSKKKD